MTLKVKLTACPADPVRDIARAARMCYGGTVRNDDAGLVQRLKEAGHLPPFEHASFTFEIEGLSRAASHQLVRHRLAGYSQRSQRYAPLHCGYVIPPEIEWNPQARAVYEEAVNAAHAAYKELKRLGIPQGDARYALPQCIETGITVTMNARELLHFFELRLCRRAHWEIRGIAREMLALVHETARALFDTAGPPCVIGACRERHPCGRPYKDTLCVLEG